MSPLPAELVAGKATPANRKIISSAVVGRITNRSSRSWRRSQTKARGTQPTKERTGCPEAPKEGLCA